MIIEVDVFQLMEDLKSLEREFEGALKEIEIAKRKVENAKDWIAHVSTGIGKKEIKA